MTPTNPAVGTSQEVFTTDALPVEVGGLSDGVTLAVSEDTAAEILTELRRIRVGIGLLHSPPLDLEELVSE